MSASVIPKELIGTDPAQKSIPITRVPVRQIADQGSTTYTNNNQIYITLPADVCDLRDSTISFFASAALNGGTYLRFPFPVSCIFNRLRIELGSSVLVDIQGYNVLKGIFVNATETGAVSNSTNEGSQTNATRASDTTTGRLYSLKLNHIDQLNQVWFLNKIKAPFRVVLTIEPNSANFMEFDGSAPTAGIVVNNVYLNYYSLQCPQLVYDLLDANIMNGNARVNCHAWDNFTQTVATATQQIITIPFRYKYINSMVAVPRLQSIVSSATTVGKFYQQFTASATESDVYLKVGQEIFPRDHYQLSNGASTNQGWVFYQQPVANIFDDELHCNTWNQNMYMITQPATGVIYPFELYGDPSDGEHISGNGINTQQNATTSNLYLTYWSASGALEIQVFAKFEQIITLLPGGSFRVDQ